MLRPDGSGLTQLTHFTDCHRFTIVGSFSSDGKLVTYAIGTGDDAGVYVMHADGSSAVRIIGTARWGSAPDWGPGR
jgi:hypothetical protein